MLGRRWIPEGRGRTLAMTFAALAAASLFTTGSAVAGSGSGCIHVDVSLPVHLPDGNTYPAGVLTLCDTAALSPVATLHKTYVNGRPIGILVSRRRANEAPSDDRPSVLFQSDGSTLDLVGYTLPSARRGVTYALNARAEMPTDELRAAASSGLSGALVVLAASAR
jgi:hypothetical protein